MKFYFLLFFLISLSLIYSQCEQGGFKIIKNTDTLIIETDKLPAQTILEVGNPNCYPITVEVTCTISGLECKVEPNIIIIYPKKTEKVNILVYGTLLEEKYTGIVTAKYSSSQGNVVVPLTYNLIIINKYKENLSLETTEKNYSIPDILYILGFLIGFLIVYVILSRVPNFKLLKLKIKLWMLKKGFI